ncbi:MAG: nucleotidyltransferase family protein [Armatimonadetes bacterium]|nr:nucleotidyltransferase family protein [Anaerolineae bacterium]
MTILPTLAALRAQREAILALAAQHGAYDVRVFGSVARGDAHPGSDIDLLVRWDYTRISAWGGVGLDMALADLLGVQVDVLSEQGLSPLFQTHVLKDAVPLRAATRYIWSIFKKISPASSAWSARARPPL